MLYGHAIIFVSSLSINIHNVDGVDVGCVVYVKYHIFFADIYK